MKVYLEGQRFGMTASLFINPHKLQHYSREDNPMTHILRIVGEDDEVMDLEGSLPELQELVKMMDEVLKGEE